MPHPDRPYYLASSLYVAFSQPRLVDDPGEATPQLDSHVCSQNNHSSDSDHQGTREDVTGPRRADKRQGCEGKG